MVLVSGKVEVDTYKYPKKVLKPNDMLTYDGQDDGLRVNTVDVSEYISWVDGYYCFNHEKIEIITEKLSRYYGKRVIPDSGLIGLTCSGKLDLPRRVAGCSGSIRKCETIPAQIETRDNYFY